MTPALHCTWWGGCLSSSMPSIFITLTGEVDNKLLIRVVVAGEGAVDGPEWKIKTFWWCPCCPWTLKNKAMTFIFFPTSWFGLVVVKRIWGALMKCWLHSLISVLPFLLSCSLFFENEFQLTFSWWNKWQKKYQPLK